jgi:preprotein translocase subunit SecD
MDPLLEPPAVRPSGSLKLLTGCSIGVMLGLLVVAYFVWDRVRPKSVDEVGGIRATVRIKPDGQLAGGLTGSQPADIVAIKDALQHRLRKPGMGVRIVNAAPDKLSVEVAGELSDADAEAVAVAITSRGDLTFRFLPELNDGTWTTRQETDQFGIEQPYETILDHDGKPVSKEVLDARVFSKPALLAGKDLKPNARADIGTGLPVVHFEFVDGPEGKQKFEDFTRTHVGKALAIFLDKRLLSAPTIEGVIPGEGIIQGRFTPEYAKELADLLNAGPLPAALEIVDTQRVRK